MEDRNVVDDKKNNLIVKIFDFILRINWRNVVKNLFIFSVTLALLYFSYNLLSSYNEIPEKQLSKAENLLLFSMSSFTSWIISAWFSTFSSTDKIDTIAEQSFEKMRDVTIQLDQTKLFLMKSLQEGKLEYKAHGNEPSRKALENRIIGTIGMIDLIATSNESLANDWFGVVSKSTQRKLREKSENLERVGDMVEGLLQEVPDDRKELGFSYKIPGAKRLLRAAADHDLGPAAIISQSTIEADNHCQSGHLTIEVIRDTYMATGSGKLDPEMETPPEIEVVLESAPDGCELSQIAFVGKTGTSYDFNVNLRSAQRNVFLKQGAYRFSYGAKVTTSENS